MARITVEDCLTRENNRFALVQLAAKRAKQLLHGSRTVISDTRGNKSVVTALREIATGQVRFMTEEEKARAKEEAEAKRLAARESLPSQSILPKADITGGESENGSNWGSHESAGG